MIVSLGPQYLFCRLATSKYYLKNIIVLNESAEVYKLLAFFTSVMIQLFIKVDLHQRAITPHFSFSSILSFSKYSFSVELDMRLLFFFNYFLDLKCDQNNVHYDMKDHKHEHYFSINKWKYKS